MSVPLLVKNVLVPTVLRKKAAIQFLCDRPGCYAAADNDPDDRACRTKLCVEPKGDIEKLFTQWDRWSWHRVTFYGDLKESTYALADAMEWKGVEEA